MANLVFVQGSKTNTGELDLEDIPNEIKDDVEQTYQLLKSRDGRVQASFPSAGEAEQYIKYVKAYCKVRPGGEIRFRKSPTRNLPTGTIEFRITDISEGEAATEPIREAVEKVKAAVK